MAATKAVKFALNEFNSNTNFSPRTTVFFKKCGNVKPRYRILTEINSPNIKNFKFWITKLFANFLKTLNSPYFSKRIYRIKQPSNNYAAANEMKWEK